MLVTIILLNPTFYKTPCQCWCALPKDKQSFISIPISLMPKA